MDNTFSDITNKLEQVIGGSGSVATHVGGAASSNAQLTSTLSGLSSSITNITQNNNNQGGLNNPTTMMMMAMAMSQRNRSTTVVDGPGYTSWRSSW